MEQKYDYIIGSFSDYNGILRGMIIPSKYYEKALTDGVGFDCSSVDNFGRIENSDMLMVIDEETLISIPSYFFQGKERKYKIGLAICKLFKNGTRFKGDPRYICEKVEKNLNRDDMKARIGGEFEYYLVKFENGKLVPVESQRGQRYFDILPGRDKTTLFGIEVCNLFQDVFGKEVVEKEHHEVGPAQRELTVKYSSPVKNADIFLQEKYLIKKLANLYGWIATDMPKPILGLPGNGYHLHFSLHDNDDKNLFFDKDDKNHLSQTCRYAIGGLLEHAPATCLITNSTINSYKRLGESEAPKLLVWGYGNRSAAIKVPTYSPGKENQARLEIRWPDSKCNPYLTNAILVEAALDGIKKKIDPGDPFNGNTYHEKNLIIRLPSSLSEAIKAAEVDDICKKTLGNEIFESLLELKKEEVKKFEKSSYEEILQQEYELYLF